MPRPQKERHVGAPPVHTDFKPTGVPKRLLGSVDLTLDEYEAIRLADYDGDDHAAAARKMGVSRSTFTRLHDRAVQKMARFLVDGLHLSIAGGAVHFRRNLFRCRNCERVFPAEFGTEIERCPYCDSESIQDLAAAHGHGDCCRHRRG
jgi:predicted DNA-binding protein (UPF0251 family)